jgi:hypothetical protein
MSNPDGWQVAEFCLLDGFRGSERKDQLWVQKIL